MVVDTWAVSMLNETDISPPSPATSASILGLKPNCTVALSEGVTMLQEGMTGGVSSSLSFLHEKITRSDMTVSAVRVRI